MCRSEGVYMGHMESDYLGCKMFEVVPVNGDYELLKSELDLSWDNILFMAVL